MNAENWNIWSDVLNIEKYSAKIFEEEFCIITT